MPKLGLIMNVDSWLGDDARLSDQHEKRLLKDAEKALVNEGFDVSAVDVFDIIQKKSSGRYIQLTVTESEEESKSGDKVNYRVPVTMVQVWIEDPSLPHSHLEKLVVHHYGKYSIKLASAMLNDLLVLVCRRLKQL